jgi:hypothetical protein
VQSVANDVRIGTALSIQPSRPSRGPHGPRLNAIIELVEGGKTDSDQLAAAAIDAMRGTKGATA